MKQIMVITKEKEKIAHKNCANYNNGKCLGVEIRVKGKPGRKVKIGLRIEETKVGKLCLDIIDKCEYFDYIVSPNSHKSPLRRRS